VELQECILTALASKTVIFVTHQVEFLPAADLILVQNCLLTLFVYFGYAVRVLCWHLGFLLDV
jgi:hypothetical protein